MRGFGVGSLTVVCGALAALGLRWAGGITDDTWLPAVAGQAV